MYCSYSSSFLFLFFFFWFEKYNVIWVQHRKTEGDAVKGKKKDEAHEDSAAAVSDTEGSESSNFSTSE